MTTKPTHETEPMPDAFAADSALTRKTPWTLKQNITRTIWMTFGRMAWVPFPSLRPRLIRLFGGKVGKNCTFATGVEVTIPWHVTIGDNVRVRSGAIIYSLGQIHIGNDSVLDSRAHLCAGTHDMSDPTFPLVRRPITIGARCLIGTDAYIAPGTELGDDCIVWPRASVYKNFPDGIALRGNPARPFDPAEAEAEEAATINHEIAMHRHDRLQQSAEPAS